MKKEVFYRITRIIVVLCVLTLAAFLRDDVRASYRESWNIYDSLINSLQVTELTNGINNKSATPTSDIEGSLTEGYKLEITNDSNKSKNVTFLLESTVENKEDRLDYKYVRYQILENNKILTTSTVNQNGTLNKISIKPNYKSTYEIKFWIIENAPSD